MGRAASWCPGARSRSGPVAALCLDEEEKPFLPSITSVLGNPGGVSHEGLRRKQTGADTHDTLRQGRPERTRDASPEW